MHAPPSVDLTFLLGGRLVAMGFPGSQALPVKDMVRNLQPSSKRGLLRIWNLSEQACEYGSLLRSGAVVSQVSFSGHPTPPLHEMFPLVRALEAWLSAGAERVAAVHCRTGRGRTNAVLACLVAWLSTGPAACSLASAARSATGGASVPAPLTSKALRHLCFARGIDPRAALFPSQLRHILYFDAILQGHVNPAPWAEAGGPLVVLQRVVLHGVPTFAQRRVPTPPDGWVDDDSLPRVLGGCRPFLQLFQLQQNGAEQWKRTISGQAARTRLSEPAAPAWLDSGDEEILFEARGGGFELRGDVTLHCRHLTEGGQRAGNGVTIFRAALHSGFVPSDGTLRLPLAQLDCAGSSGRRYPDGFWVELHFSGSSGSSGADSAVGGTAAATPGAKAGWSALRHAVALRAAASGPPRAAVTATALPWLGRGEDAISIAGCLPLPACIAFLALKDCSSPEEWPLAKVSRGCNEKRAAGEAEAGSISGAGTTCTSELLSEGAGKR